MVVTGGGHTRVLFDAPVALSANVEYALVVLCDDVDDPAGPLRLAQRLVEVFEEPFELDGDELGLAVRMVCRVRRGGLTIALPRGHDTSRF